jgi:hypothetical protein
MQPPLLPPTGYYSWMYPFSLPPTGCYSRVLPPPPPPPPGSNSTIQPPLPLLPSSYPSTQPPPPTTPATQHYAPDAASPQGWPEPPAFTSVTMHSPCTSMAHSNLQFLAGSRLHFRYAWHGWWRARRHQSPMEHIAAVKYHERCRTSRWHQYYRDTCNVLHKHQYLTRIPGSGRLPFLTGSIALKDMRVLWSSIFHDLPYLRALIQLVWKVTSRSRSGACQGTS